MNKKRKEESGMKEFLENSGKVINKLTRDQSFNNQQLINLRKSAEQRVAFLENVLISKGYHEDVMEIREKFALEELNNKMMVREEKLLILPKFEHLVLAAQQEISSEPNFSGIYPWAESYKTLDQRFKDTIDLNQTEHLICIGSAMVGFAIDMVFRGGPEKVSGISGMIQGFFDNKLSEETVKELEKQAKVTFDQSVNSQKFVERAGHKIKGLSPNLHHITGVGHDPSPAGIITGVKDVMKNTATFMDSGEIRTIDMEGFFKDGNKRVAKKLVEAFNLVVKHQLSDINGTRGLPAPFTFVIGYLENFGDYGQLIFGIVEKMYLEGYDFRYHLSTYPAALITDILVRVCWAIKLINESEGKLTIKKVIPMVNLNTIEGSKLGRMLFYTHLEAVALNTGFITVTFKCTAGKSLLKFNYGEWVMLARYGITQSRWLITKKSKLRDKFREGKFEEAMKDFEETYKDLFGGYIIKVEEEG